MSINLLETAAANFVALLNTVDDAQWGTATACCLLYTSPSPRDS